MPQTLWLLTSVFLVRVLAQPLSRVAAVPGLPPFEAFQSGLVSYPLLVLAQAVILTAMAVTSWKASTGRLSPRPGIGLALLIAGGIYFVSMIARLAIGLVWLRESPFFARPVPTFFHLVLASFLIVCGWWHRREDLSRSRRPAQ
jgi:hypothetical protein